MLTLIENGNVYGPEPLGRASVLVGFDRILKVGKITVEEVEALDIPLSIVDAEGCCVAPGFIDPHEHLLGGSGEEGFATQTPEIYRGEIILGGITTVVGCLGVDTVMKTMAGLLARAKALDEEGLNAFIWSGGYDVPPASVTDSARNDIMFIKEVIGMGELAIADERSKTYELNQLASTVIDAHNGGMLARTSGVTHFHVGSGEDRLKLLRDLIEGFPIQPAWLYPTHISRTDELMIEAIELANHGSYVDMDVADQDLPEKLQFYIDNGGPLDRLTFSSDASITSPQTLFEQVRECVTERVLSFAEILPCITSNTASVLKLGQKGEIAPGKVADITILDAESLSVKHVFAKGEHLLDDGSITDKEEFLKESNRVIHLRGEKLGDR